MIQKIAIATLPVLIGALLYSITTRRQKDKEGFKIVCDKLHHSFLDTIVMFSDQEVTDRLYDHLITSFVVNKKGVIDFGRHLNWFQRRSFHKAWNNYRYSTNKAYPPPDRELGIPHLVQYHEGLAWGDAEETKKLVLKRIHKTLSYAKIK